MRRRAREPPVEDRGYSPIHRQSMSNSSPDIERRRSIAETLLFAGGAAISFVLGLLRTKAQAIAWGPTGVGGLGLMQASLSTATLVGGVGVDGLVTRDLAAHDSPRRNDEIAAVAVRGSVLLACVACGGATVIFGLLPTSLGFSGWADAFIVGVGVAFAILAANQRALLAGLRRTRDLAVAQVAAAVVGTVLAVSLVVLPAGTMVWAAAVTSIPLTQFVIFATVVRRVTRADALSWVQAAALLPEFALRAGPLAIAGVLPVLTQLLIRTSAHRAMNELAFGSFQATMSLAAISVSVLASSVGPSVLPRLSKAAASHAELRDELNSTIADYLRLYAPVAIILAALPELATRLLFSRDFGGVSEQLPWQLVGEVFRLPCWVMATALTAQARFRTYLLVEASSLVVSVLAVSLSAPSGSPAVVGAALSAATVCQFVILAAALSMTGVVLRLAVLRALSTVAAVVIVAAAWSSTVVWVRAAVVLAAFLFAASAFKLLARLRQR